MTLDKIKKELIGHFYYEEEIPVGIIEDITKYNSDNYILKLKQNEFTRKLWNTDLPYKEIDELELLDLYNKYNIRLERSSFLKKNNINNLVHFTKLKNLESILEEGILSRDSLDLLGYEYAYSDPYRLDGKLDKVSTSITFPNYKMFYSKRMENQDEEWVVLTIKSNILLHKLSTEFYKTNCASSIFYKDGIDHTENRALYGLFTPKGREENLEAMYPTDPQAEVLIDNYVDENYLKHICTYKNNDYVKKLAYQKQLNYMPNSSLFNSRDYFIRGYNGY